MKASKEPHYVYTCEHCGRRFTWVALTKRQFCNYCGKRNIRREGEVPGLRYKVDERGGYQDEEFSYIVFARGKIEGGQRQRAIWQKTEDGLYITCAGCAGIVDVSRENVDDGYVPGCVVCPECLSHFWVYLEDWKEDGP